MFRSICPNITHSSKTHKKGLEVLLLVFGGVFENNFNKCVAISRARAGSDINKAKSAAGQKVERKVASSIPPEDVSYPAFNPTIMIVYNVLSSGLLAWVLPLVAHLRLSTPQLYCKELWGVLTTAIELLELTNRNKKASLLTLQNHHSHLQRLETCSNTGNTSKH